LIGQQYSKDHPAPAPTVQPNIDSRSAADLGRPQESNGAPLLEGEVRSLAELRERMKQLGYSEHAADNRGVLLRNYPTLVKASVNQGMLPASDQRGTGLASGQSMDLQFADEVHGFGLYLKQGLYPTSVIAYFKDHSQRAVSVNGYMPATEFVGLASRAIIERVIIQPQAAGYCELVSFHIFAKRYHERKLQ
jgi:hypothetical protein